MFSPIRRVAYDVEAARVGQRTDYDKLILDVTTNGSIDPKDAIAQAAEILIRQLAIFTDLDKIEGFGAEATPLDGGAMVDVSLAHGMENFPIEELELGVRSYNCLKRVGIETIGDLVTKTENELASIPNFGKKSIEEVKETLGQHGLRLRGDNGGRLGALEIAGVMRHQRTGKKLGRDSAHRRALYANLTAELIEHGRIKTTVTKAKAVKPIAEQMITLGRRGDIHARRQAVAFLGSKDIVHKLFAEVGPRFAERPGGYSRIVRLGPRPGDSAEMVYLELVDTPLVFKTRLSDVEAEEAPAVGGGRGPEPRPGEDAEARGRRAGG